MKQISTQRTIQSCNSQAKPRRRGLSLTSQSKCPSIQKNKNHNFILSQQSTFQSQITYRPQSQINRHQSYNQSLSKNNNSLSSRQSFLSVTQQSKSKPKITFRYTNELTNNQTPNSMSIINSARQNPFVITSRPSVIQYQKRYLNHVVQSQSQNNNYATNIKPQSVTVQTPLITTQSYIITKSIQKQKAQQTNIQPKKLSFNTESNATSFQNIFGRQILNPPFNPIQKPLIDSRRIDRQIITQQSYLNVPLINSRVQFTHRSNQHIPNLEPVNNTYNPISKQDFWTKSITTSQIRQSQDGFNKDCGEKLNQSKLKDNSNVSQKYIEYNRSPYHLLLSTAKKCQSKEMSPSKFNDLQKISQLGIFSLQKIPQINEFDLKDQYKNTQNLPKSQNNITLKNNLIQIINEDSQQDNPQEDSPLKSKQFNTVHMKTQRNSLYIPLKKNQTPAKQIKKVIQSQKKDSIITIPKNGSNKKQKSNSKNKHKQQKSMVSQIQNQAPSTLRNTINSNISSTNTKRNSRRIRQISKRLQEIITICDKNL